jgi:phosphoribosylamine-glycine ligase
MASSDYPYAETPLESSVLPRSILGVSDESIMITASAIKAHESVDMIATQRGRVFTIVAKASSFDLARQKVYAVIAELKKLFPSAQFRRDIAAESKLV